MIEYELVISPEADLQIRETALSYDDRQIDLGFDFLLMVEKALKDIMEAPLMYPVYYRHFRKRNVKRFPYILIYEVKDHNIKVLVLLHHSQDIDRILSKLP